MVMTTERSLFQKKRQNFDGRYENKNTSIGCVGFMIPSAGGNLENGRTSCKNAVV